MRDMGEHKNPDNPVDFMAFTVADAENEVKQAAAAEEDINMGSGIEGESAAATTTTASAPAFAKPSGRSSSAGAFTFEFPPIASGSASASASASSSHSSMSNGSSTPSHRRRSAAPTSIPNFPSNSQPRDSPFSPSPTGSPGGGGNARYAFPSPSATPPPAPSLGRLPTPSFSMNGAGGGGGGMPSPWHMLAASSGAPTPSIDGPGMGRNSPHLGSPFEKLNIGGSWSGANLDQLAGPAGPRRASLEPPNMSLGLSTSPGKGLSFDPSSSGGFQFGGGGGGGANGVKSPLGGQPLGHDDGMVIDPPEASSSSTTSTSSAANANAAAKKPPLPPTLAMRRASLPKNHVNVHGSVSGKTSSPLASSSTPPSSSGSGFGSGPSTKAKPLIVGQLGSVLAKPATLVLDLRPPSSYQASHIPESHSLPIPSTLLRRPAFTIQKLTQMLSATSMEAVSHWRDTSDIVMVDQDSGAAPDGSVLDGLAGKFAREGYSGQLWFVKGGHRAIQTSGTALLGGEADTTDEPGQTGSGLMAGGMGRLAFQQSSTGGGLNSPLMTMRSNPTETPGFALRLDPFDTAASPGPKASPGFKVPATPAPAQSSNTGSALGSGSGAGSGSGSGSGRRVSFQGAIDCADVNNRNLQPANPFFDNIRQNLELSHGGITERIPLGLPADVKSRAHELPPFLRDLVLMSEQDGAEKLANQFYEIELGEQRRLQAVMNWHTQDSGVSVASETAGEQETQQTRDRQEVDRLVAWGDAQLNPAISGFSSPTPSASASACGTGTSGHLSAGTGREQHYFPFSITAGVERGTKNRYKNIWPYDFSRVRLGAPADDSDYINASYVQPRGTTRRYIATQGPLDATYCDFWTLIWEQDVRIIVMITKQFEGGSIKCGNYWEGLQYGPVRLQLVSQTGGEDKAYKPTTGFDFGMAASTTPRDEGGEPDKPVSHIKRVFHVTHKDYPDAKPREVVQIQCVSWPDFDVPHSADVLLSLIRQVDASFCDMFGSASNLDRQQVPPVLVHCSAGVGRTGSFIVVDAILDGLRREHRLPPASTSRPGPRPTPVVQEPRPKLGASRASSGEKPSPLPPLVQPTPIVATAAAGGQEAIPEMSERNARATDQQYQAESFQKHRRGGGGEEAAGNSMSVNSGDFSGLANRRRLSLIPSGSNSSGTSQSRVQSDKSEKMSQIEESMDKPRAVTFSSMRHRSPSPISTMENPVWEVLEGMRVQRMSLVQSLRQYVFVYRAIITAYLQLLDADPDHHSSAGNAVTGSIMIPTTSSSSMSEDDIHSKRRASPTELVPDLDGNGNKVHPHSDEAITGAGSAFGSENGNGAGSGSANLVKRPSFKKMRSSAVEGISLASRAPASTSPKKAQSKA